MEPPKSCLFSLNNLETNDEIDAEYILDKDFLLQTLTGIQYPSYPLRYSFAAFLETRSNDYFLAAYSLYRESTDLAF
jgi:hypothetical protein